jgi:hypothetical protein
MAHIRQEHLLPLPCSRHRQSSRIFYRCWTLKVQIFAKPSSLSQVQGLMIGCRKPAERANGLRCFGLSILYNEMIMKEKKGTINAKGRMTGTRLCGKGGFVILSSQSQEDWSCCLPASLFSPRLEDFFPGSAGTNVISFS